MMIQNLFFLKVFGITTLSNRIIMQFLILSDLQSEGIKTVFDLIDLQGNFSSWNPLAEEFNLSAVDFLEWYGLMKCIPKEWKNLVNNTDFIPEMIDLEQLSLYQHCVYINDTLTDILKVKSKPDF